MNSHDAGARAARLSPAMRQYLDLLNRPVQYAPGMGPRRAEAIAALDVRTVGDLLLLLPRRYEDRRKRSLIAQAPLGEPVSIAGEVQHVSLRRPRSARGGVRNILEVRIGDDSGSLVAVWFNQAYRAEQLAPGRKVLLYGAVELRGGKRQMTSPELEFRVGGEQAPVIAPIYPLTQGFTQRAMQTIVRETLRLVLPLVFDPIPAALLELRGLPVLRDALRVVHEPDVLLAGASAGGDGWRAEVERARRRLAYEELFVLECMLARRRARDAQTAARRCAPVTDANSLPARFAARLPFALTAAQRRCIEELAADMSGPRPMNRLLQGDVGSGKTVVMLHAMLQAVQSGYQAVLMAPTELLAEQHRRTVLRLLGDLPVSVGLLTGGAARLEKEETLWSAAAHECDIVIGTHALFQERVSFRRVGLVVIDEQHKFGVEQRALLLAKGRGPHVLVTSATPIPRSLALTLYGDLDVSLLDELPPGRGKVLTRWTWESKLEAVYGWLESKFAEDRQAYLVCPVIDASETLEHLHPAIETAERMRARFPHRRVDLVHGRLKPEERERALAAFAAGNLDMLVATTVIEVGVDIPNATIMIILNAERYGLAQLHQLRGRVGRGNQQSYCVLVTSDKLSSDGKERMRALVETNDGFEIAERDLALRGPGELTGTRQHGVMLFRVAELPRDEPLLLVARRDAYRLVGEDPRLEHPGHALLRAAVERSESGWAAVR